MFISQNYGQKRAPVLVRRRRIRSYVPLLEILEVRTAPASLTIVSPIALSSTATTTVDAGKLSPDPITGAPAYNPSLATSETNQGNTTYTGLGDVSLGVIGAYAFFADGSEDKNSAPLFENESVSGAVPSLAFVAEASWILVR
jgi:hypothetical protein